MRACVSVPRLRACLPKYVLGCRGLQRAACTGAYPPFVHACRVRVGDSSYISIRSAGTCTLRACIRYRPQDCLVSPILISPLILVARPVSRCLWNCRRYDASRETRLGWDGFRADSIKWSDFRTVWWSLILVVVLGFVVWVFSWDFWWDWWYWMRVDDCWWIWSLGGCGVFVLFGIDCEWIVGRFVVVGDLCDRILVDYLVERLCFSWIIL